MGGHKAFRHHMLSVVEVSRCILHNLEPLLRQMTPSRLSAVALLLMTLIFASFNLVQNGYSVPFLTGTVLTALAMLSYFYLVLKIYRISISTMLSYFLLGIFALGVSVAASNLYVLLAHIDTSSLVFISVVTPAIEEVTKALFVAAPYFIISRMQRFSSRTTRPTIIPLALMIGITFSQLETLGLRGWSSTEPLRMVEYIVIPAHAAFTGFFGIFVEISSKESRPLLIPLGLAAAIVMHISANTLVILSAVYPELQIWMHLYFAAILLIMIAVMLVGFRFQGGHLSQPHFGSSTLPEE